MGNVPTLLRWLVPIVSLLASSASAYEIGHVSLSFALPTCGNSTVGAEVYYPADSPGDGVPVATPPAGGFPTVSFGHGFLIGVPNYGNIWEALVPEGYVVALPTTELSILPNHGQFGDDLACTLEQLGLEGQTPGSLFFGKLTGDSAVLGHSMGGGASFLAGAADGSIAGVANLAAAETNPSAIAASAQIDVPVLLFSAGDDCVTPPAAHQIPMYDASTSSCRTLVTLDGASHCQFALNNLVCNLGEFCSASISRETQHQRVADLLIPWLDAVLKQQPGAWQDFMTTLTVTPSVVWEQDCPDVPGPDCSDGVDNDGDGDGEIDHPADPGCDTPTGAREDPACDDGVDNDLDGGIDHDGAGIGPADAQCVGNPSRNRERAPCGLGFELAFLLAVVRRPGAPRG